MDYCQFITDQVLTIREAVGDGKAICALSGGVDSSVVTMLADRALGMQLQVVFIDSGLMRLGEPEEVLWTFAELDVAVRLVKARGVFLQELSGLTDPEEKREAITRAFYAKVFADLVRESGAKFLLHGTILTDVDETVAGVKRQHNILMQIGIDPEKDFGYRVLEPLVTLRKDGVREVARALGLPSSISERIPFPGPGLAARIIGEVTEEKLAIVRAATVIVEACCRESGAFQYFAVLLNDRGTGIIDGKRAFGHMIAIRCVDSVDAREATATKLDWDTLELMAAEIAHIPGVTHVLYDLTSKPPATVEYI